MPIQRAPWKTLQGARSVIRAASSDDPWRVPMKSDNRAYLELSWDDKTADAILTVFHDQEGHQVGIYCKPVELYIDRDNDDTVQFVKDLLVQVVESL